MNEVTKGLCTLIGGWIISTHRLALVFIILTLGACGGGGSDDQISSAARAQGVFGLESITPSPFVGSALSSDQFVITFTKPLKASTVSPDTVGIWDEATQRVVPTTVELTDRQIRVTSQHILTPNSQYTLVATDELRSIYGERFEGLIVFYKIDAFEMYRSSPSNNETDVHADYDIQLEFTRPVVLTTLEENLVLYDVTAATTIPFTIYQSHGSYEEAKSVVRINPDFRLSAGHTIEFRADSGVRSINDEPLHDVSGIFTVSDQWVAPKVQDFYPEPDVEIDPYDSIVITFTQDIDPSTVAEDDVFLRQTSGFYKTIATKTTVSGPRVTITPIEPLQYSTRYEIARGFAGNSTFLDMQGVRAVGTLNWFFKTRSADDELPLDFHPTHHAVNKDISQVFAYDNATPSIARINLTEFNIVDYLELDTAPRSVCVEDTHVYVLTLLEEKDEEMEWSIQEFDANSLVETGASTIKHAKENVSDSSRAAINCAAGRVYFVAYRNLYEIHIDAARDNNLSLVHAFVNGIELINSNDDILIYSYNEFYRLDDSEVVKLPYNLRSRRSGEGIWQADIESNLLVVGDSIYTIDTDEKLTNAGRSSNGSIDEYVLAVDFENMRWFAGQSIYSLEDLSKIGPVYELKGSLSFFDHYGSLYYTGLKSFRRIDHSKITAGLLGD